MERKKIIIASVILTFVLIAFRTPLTSLITSLFPKKVVHVLSDPKIVENALTQTGRYDENAKLAYFQGEKIPVPSKEILNPNIDVLGLKAYASADEKWIEVDVTNQRILAHEGDQVVYNFPISSGMPWTPTVVGTFRIWSKLRFTRMAGGWSIGDPYDLPNVPYTMYYYKGYAIHGAYWHNDFGRPKSHGCVNMAIPDSEKLYYWANPPTPPGSWGARSTPENPGTKVVVHGQARL